MNEFAMTLPLFFAGEREITEKYSNKEVIISFNKFFIPEKKALYNFILKSVSFSEDSNDIYQNTALRAFKYFRKFDTSKRFKPWVFSIALNEIRKYFKNKIQSSDIHSIENSYEQIPDTQNRELAEAVYSAAYSLKNTEREIFFLFYDSGFNISEISEITGKTQGNIKVILSNARKRVKSFLGSKK